LFDRRLGLLSLFYKKQKAPKKTQSFILL